LLCLHCDSATLVTEAVIHYTHTHTDLFFFFSSLLVLIPDSTHSSTPPQTLKNAAHDTQTEKSELASFAFMKRKKKSKNSPGLGR